MGAQYLLGLLCEKNNITPTCMSEKFSEKNNYYKHYVGNIKYQSPPVPSTHIIQFQSKIFI